ncbi:flagellar hook protein FlgE [Fibrobacteria bacterium R8-3-H12]
MLRSLNSGVAGLMNHQVRMDVIGNNISNVNTVGFKGRRVTFEESFNQLVKGATRTESKAGGTNPMQVGLGVSVGSVDVMTGQGNLQNTGRIFDLAIEGNAFFGVSDGNETYYTRNGAFQLDSEGYIILPTNGMVLQGKMADSFGNFPAGTAIGNVQIPMSQQAPAKETTEMSIGRNLNSNADAKGTVTYSQRMLHPADPARQPKTNSLNDPGRETTNLNALYNSKGQSLNMKENDTITISWFDQASVIPGTPPTGELVVKISEVAGDLDGMGRMTTVWTIDDFVAAIQTALNTDRNGVPTGTAHLVNLEEDGTLRITYDAGTVTPPPDPQIFSLQVKSSNPLSDSYVNKAFQFGSHIGPKIGNYPENFKGISDVLLRPAEQFDYMYDLRDQNGNKLHPGLDAGDPIDVFGAIGKTSIENGKSDPINFYPGTAYDTSYTGPSPLPVFIRDQPTLTEIDAYNKWVQDVDKWVAKNPPATPYTDFAAKEAAYIGSGVTRPTNIPNLPSSFTDGVGTSDSIVATDLKYYIDEITGAIKRIEVDGSSTYFSADGSLENATLLDDLLSKIRNDFKLPKDYIERDGSHQLSVGMNPVGTDDGIPPGSIVIRGSKGEDFAINQLSIRGVNSNADNLAPTLFNASMGFTQKRKAENVGTVDITESVYDESGAEHILTITFVHTGRAGEWEWKATFAGKEDIVPGSGSGKLTFGLDGTVSSWTYDNDGSQLQVDPHNGSSMMNISLNVGGPGDFRGITQFDSASTVNSLGQNGYTTGNLIEVTIDEFGLLEGTFSNGTNRKIAQIMFVDFANPGGLLDMTDSVYTTSANSGDPIWGLPLTQSSSKVKPGAVEMSNVDLSAEFTNMITTQRGYQANSRVITVSDTMLEELVNLKR